jgi:hypothetical protein
LFKWPGKERRKPYRRSKAFDRSCRNGGSCSWCLGNRMHSTRKREEAAQEWSGGGMALGGALAGGSSQSRTTSSIGAGDVVRHTEQLEHLDELLGVVKAIGSGVQIQVIERAVELERRYGQLFDRNYLDGEA